ncbi:hypothetical protein CSUI_010747, partial [Cystoisospora suis]
EGKPSISIVAISVRVVLKSFSASSRLRKNSLPRSNRYFTVVSTEASRRSMLSSRLSWRADSHVKR